METLNNYNIKEYNFALWFFRLILLIMVTLVMLLILLNINETVAINEGEIVSINPQADYKAPFEAQIEKIYVKEGMPVKAGDTLLVLQNTDYLTQQLSRRTEIEYLQKKIQSIIVLQGTIQKKKAAIDYSSEITSNKYQLDINRVVNDMKMIDQQYNYQKSRLALADEKYEGDSMLYKKDMLSKYEYNKTKEAHSILKENLSNIQSLRNKQYAEKNLAYNDFTRERNNLLLNRVQLEENEQALLQAKNDYESQLVQAKEALRKIEIELSKQNVIATYAGIVNFVFNTKQASNLINKGDLLISIAPKTISYYAKVIVPEKDMPYVKAGLLARLKLDAYQSFEHGPINGKVSYVAERKENEKFYALVELFKGNRFQLKSGYTIHGEIVVTRLPLYKFFVKKLFKRVENV